MVKSPRTRKPPNSVVQFRKIRTMQLRAADAVRASMATKAVMGFGDEGVLITNADLGERTRLCL